MPDPQLPAPSGDLLSLSDSLSTLPRQDAGIRVYTLKQLLSDPGTREAFDQYVLGYREADREMRYVALEKVCEGLANPRPLLTSLLLLGGTPAKPAIAMLRQAGDKGDLEALQLIRTLVNYRAIYPGSFDPITKGHLNVIERASHLFDELIVGVGINPGKNPLFTQEERVRQVREAVAHLPGAITVQSFSGLLVKFAELENVRTIIRGLRTATEWEQELTQARANLGQSKGKLETLFLPTLPSLDHVSSSYAKGFAQAGGELDEYVTPEIKAAMMAKLQAKND